MDISLLEKSISLREVPCIKGYSSFCPFWRENP
jgi:hypothetical protein